MRMVIQRVKHASVTVDGKITGKSGRALRPCLLMFYTAKREAGSQVQRGKAVHGAPQCQRRQQHVQCGASGQ